ncbi:MAG: NADP-dependent phosphogluconate dehydrogenase [Acidaminococcaceae bacterium]|nr:NADP-dependent phosphogluconate dehydrogenase [Acidaminococcaceae bacterium]
MQAKIGLIGLAVMGANLARNLANHNIQTLVFNRTAAKTEQFMKDFGDNPCLQAAYSLEELVQNLERPRKIILMIQAGAPVDAMLDTLTPLLEAGDIVIDGGNSYFEDTRRRSAKLAERGMEFVGMGVSGGEEGALHGPSLMPGCSRKAYVQLEPMLQAISAKAREDGKEPCVTYIGSDGAGHYVKMVHNGIEYADMQLIADVYTIMRHVLGMEAGEMADVWDEWNKGELSSYLVEITANILRKKDAETGKPMVDVILDVAKQKGTGRWTSMSALELGVATPTITEAVFARNMSTYKEERKELEKVYAELPGAAIAADENMTVAAAENKKAAFTEEEKAQLLEDLRNTLYAAKICAYAQGFNLMGTASETYGWDLQMDKISKIWRNGCIIRARFLDDVSDSFAKQSGMKNLLFSDFFADALKKGRAGWGRVVALAAERGVSVVALSSALSYFDAYRTASGNANVLQAQRDYFGAHTYQRVDKEGSFHTEWME